jgi:hypothetical protein
VNKAYTLPDAARHNVISTQTKSSPADMKDTSKSYSESRYFSLSNEMQPAQTTAHYTTRLSIVFRIKNGLGFPVQSYHSQEKKDPILEVTFSIITS